jgi:glycerate 2-kinase
VITRTGVIENLEELLSHGNREGRRVALDVLEAGLVAPDPYDNVLSTVRIEGKRLIVGNPALSQPQGQAPVTFDLDQVGNIYVVGGGKAAQREAEALEHVLGDRITEGHINAKKGDSIRLKRIGVTLAGHPIPDEESVEGAKRILEIERKARKGDIVFLCVSGGATSLTALPVPGVSLADLQEVYRVLYFGAGANMPAANAVRNHLALMNTKFARYLGDATLVSILTTETPPKLRVHLFQRPDGSDPYKAAVDVLRSYHCWDAMPQSVRDFLLARDPQYGPLRREETQGKPHYHFRVMGPEYMLDAGLRRARELGLNATVLVSSLSDVEAVPVAETMAFMAHEAEVLGRPLQPPCVLLFGGELLVSVGAATGVGGRSQEFCLATAARIAGSENIVIASADSDGSDGPSDAAGGVVDGQTVARAKAAGVDIEAELANHNSNPALKTLGDTIHTGIRPTNVRDLRVIYVGGSDR